MTQRAKILSFDEVRANGSVTSRYPRRTSSESSSMLRSPARLDRRAGAAPSASSRPARGRVAASSVREGSKTRNYTAERAYRTRSNRSEALEASEDVESNDDSASSISAASFAKKIQKRFRSRQAERKFERTIGSRERAEAQAQRSQGESRAAMYSMSGSSQKRASRIQSSGSEAKLPSVSVPGFLSGISSSPVAMRVLGGCIVLGFVCFMLLPPLGDYYKEVRGYQQLEAEYAQLDAYNTQMQAQIDYLNTDEGLEEYARTELGYIRSGEHAVSVEGLSSSSSTETAQSDSSDMNLVVSEGSVAAPDTWYSGVLDVVFGYNG